MQDNDGNDSGYESDEESVIKGKENAILQRVNDTIADLRNELKSGESFLAGTFVNIARSNKGIIDLKLQDFLVARRSFLEEDPDDEKNKGKDVKSLLASLKAIDKKIAKMEKEGIGSKYFADFKHEVDDYRSKIAEVLSTNDGVRALVNKRLVGQLFTDVKIMGMDSNGNPKTIDPEKRKAFFLRLLLISRIFRLNWRKPCCQSKIFHN